MSAESVSLEEAPKRGRGRPKGSLNKATIARMQAEAASSAVEGFDPASLVLDADFDSDEIMGTAEAAEPPRAAQVLSEPEAAEPPRVAQVAEAEVLSEPEVEPAPRLKRALSVTTKRARVRRAAARSASPEDAPEAREAPRRRRAVASRTASTTSASHTDSVDKPSVAESPYVPTYLEVLKRGLEMAKAAHKAERVARYDNFFRM